jgi:phosphoribosylglycinamide formyltransferase-1
MQIKRIAIFASGQGSNAINIIDHFNHHDSIRVELVLSNRSDAPVLDSARKKGVSVISLDNSSAANAETLLSICNDSHIDLIVLAGYLRKIPEDLIRAFPEKIINIHPALLPKYGGLGMYGDRVHEAVLNNHEKETGITIHFVNEHFDEGRIIAQFHCPVFSSDTINVLRERIHRLEHNWFPVVIEKIAEELD